MMVQVVPFQYAARGSSGTLKPTPTQAFPDGQETPKRRFSRRLSLLGLGTILQVSLLVSPAACALPRP
jgi:hypothetical protein